MSISQVTVTGTFKGSDGTPSKGQVLFQLSSELSDGSSLIIVPKLRVATLNGGAFSILLYATDDATTQPTGAFYTITFNIDGNTWTETNIALPHATTPVDITKLVKF